MGRKPLGPEKDFQYADQAQRDAVLRAAAEDEVREAEMIRRLIAYGLVMREKARTDDT